MNNKEEILDILKRWREAVNSKVNMKVEDDSGKEFLSKLILDTNNAINSNEIEKYYYLIDSDGGEHEFHGTFKDAKAEAIERGYDPNAIGEAE